jgi:hypothetical protein
MSAELSLAELLALIFVKANGLSVFICTAFLVMVWF